jgi:hypothetical protein
MKNGFPFFILCILLILSFFGFLIFPLLISVLDLLISAFRISIFQHFD